MFLSYTEKNLLKEMIKIPSLSDKEDGIMKFLKHLFDKACWTNFEITVNEKVSAILVVFGTPKVLFVSHVDVVDAPESCFEPYEKGGLVFGRGACDAKGSISSMILACSELSKTGKTDFGLLLYAGQEKGAPCLSQCVNYLQGFGVEYVVMGEPTQNKLASSHLGALCLNLKFYGEARLSAYSNGGVDANKYMIAAANKFYSLDENLMSMNGIWSINLGRLYGGLSANTLSPYAAMEVYIRTKSTNHAEIIALINDIAPEAKIEVLFSAQSLNLEVVEGFKTSDAKVCSSLPFFSNLNAKLMMLGPGDPKLAHTSHECVSEEELIEATVLYLELYKNVKFESPGDNSKLRVNEKVSNYYYDA